jgi:hypothetical protein
MQDNAELHVVMLNYETVNDQLAPYLDIKPEDINVDIDDDADIGTKATTRLNRRKKQFDETEEIDYKENIKKRMRRHLYFNMIQSFCFFALIVIWCVFLNYERNTVFASWMNFSIENRLFADS